MVSRESGAQQRTPGWGRDDPAPERAVGADARAPTSRDAIARERRAGVAAGGDGVTALGHKLRARRTQLRVTLATLAERVGCAKSYLSAIENGRKGPPTQALLTKLESALRLEPGELVRVAAWDRTPPEIRTEAAARSRAREEAIRRLSEVLREAGGSGGLDEAHQSGELRKLIDQLSPGEDGVGAGELVPLALPREVPLINRVAAGYPTGFTDLGFPARVADEYVRCPDLDDPDAFAARVIGDSMDPAYREGDVVVFSPAHDIADGDDCFARLEPDHESTFKRVYFERGPAGEEMIRLQPVNNRYAPRTLAREEVAGLYRAVMVMRSV